LAEEVEGAGLLTLTENELVCFEADVGRTPGYEAEVPLREIVKKQVLTQSTF
jgi:hypothetical protein